MKTIDKIKGYKGIATIFVFNGNEYMVMAADAEALQVLSDALGFGPLNEGWIKNAIVISSESLPEREESKPFSEPEHRV